MIYAVGGGKGGVGKSFVSTNLAYALSLRSRQVICIDGDLGGANLHACFGLKGSHQHLGDFIAKRVSSLSDILIDSGVENLQLICGANGNLDLANPRFRQKHKLIQAIQELDADDIVIDLGSGCNYDVLDLFNCANIKIAVTSPEPTALQNLYGFLKNALFRMLLRDFGEKSPISKLLHERLNSAEKEGSTQRIDNVIESLRESYPEASERLEQLVSEYRVHLVVNSIETEKQRKAPDVLQNVVGRFLSMSLKGAGFIPFDPLVRQSVSSMTPLLKMAPNSSVAEAFYAVEERLWSTHTEDASSLKEHSSPAA